MSDLPKRQLGRTGLQVTTLGYLFYVGDRRSPGVGLRLQFGYPHELADSSKLGGRGRGGGRDRRVSVRAWRGRKWHAVETSVE